MTAQTCTKLHPEFDLLYDLKCVEHLYAHLKGEMIFPVHATHGELLDTMAQHNIPLPEGYVPQTLAELTPDECRAEYKELLELVRELHLHAKRQDSDDNMPMDRSWVLEQTGLALAKAPGLSQEERAAYAKPSPFLKT